MSLTLLCTISVFEMIHEKEKFASFHQGSQGSITSNHKKAKIRRNLLWLFSGGYIEIVEIFRVDADRFLFGRIFWRTMDSWRVPRRRLQGRREGGGLYKDLKSRSGSPCRPLIAGSFRNVSHIFSTEFYLHLDSAVPELVIIEKRSQFSSGP